MALALLLALDSSGRAESAAAARLVFTRAVACGEEPVIAVSVSRGRGLAAGGRRDGSVVVWDVRTWAELRRFAAHDGSCYAAAWSPDGKTLATAGLDGAVRLWNASTWAPERTLRPGGGPVVAIAFASGGRRVLAAGADGVESFDADTGLRLHRGGASSVAALGDRAASGGNDGVVRLWDLAASGEVRSFAAHAGPVRAVAFQPGGGALVTAGLDRSIHVWDSKTGRKLRTLAGHEAPVRALAFFPGGATLASAGMDGVRLWDVSSGRLLRALGTNGVSACGVSVGLGGRQLVATGGDNRIWVWSADGSRSEAPTDTRPVGFLGVSYVDGGGALVQGVFPDSPAEKTGFRAGDVIVGVDDVPVEKSEDFLDYMRRSHEGDDVHVKVKRGDEVVFIRVKLSRWKDQ